MNEKKPVSNVCYQIAAKNGRVLEVADFNTASGAAVQLWDNVKKTARSGCLWKWPRVFTSWRIS